MWHLVGLEVVAVVAVQHLVLDLGPEGLVLGPEGLVLVLGPAGLALGHFADFVVD